MKPRVLTRALGCPQRPSTKALETHQGITPVIFISTQVHSWHLSNHETQPGHLVISWTPPYLALLLHVSCQLLLWPLWSGSLAGAAPWLAISSNDQKAQYHINMDHQRMHTRSPSIWPCQRVRTSSPSIWRCQRVHTSSPSIWRCQRVRTSNTSTWTPRNAYWTLMWTPPY